MSQEVHKACTVCDREYGELDEEATQGRRRWMKMLGANQHDNGDN